MAKDINGFLIERVESIYVSDEYKVFLLTGQAQVPGGRRAFISVKPFNEMTPEKVDALKQHYAQPAAEGRLTLSANGTNLLIYDGFTGTQSSYDIAKLDEDVKARLQVAAEQPWQKYTGPQPGPKKNLKLAP